MTKDEMKNRISMALKDPVLQQGFEIICKENAELKRNKKTVVHLADCLEEKMKERIEELETRCNELFLQNNEFAERFEKSIEIIEKSIEIIKGLLYCCRNYLQVNAEKMEQAEQFLKGENIILEDAQAGNSPFDADEVFNKEMKAYPEEK